MQMNFDFNITPLVTKYDLLRYTSDEAYMQYYLNVNVESKKLFRSPLREDVNPTCSFYRNSSGELIFHDFATNQHLNFIGVVMAKFGCNYHKAIDIIASDFNITSTNIPKTIVKATKIPKKQGISNIRVQIKDFTDNELKWWESYGITPKILNKFHIYSVKNVFIDNNVCGHSDDYNMIYGYYGGKQDSQELWRVYFPRRHTYRFLSNWSAKHIQGLKQLKKSGNLLVITKSLKDVACLYSLGINAIAPNSETLFISETLLSELKNRFKYIVCLYDNDEAGLSNMKRIKESYNIETYYIPLSYKAKDISDFYKLYGRTKTINFIKTLWAKYSQTQA